MREGHLRVSFFYAVKKVNGVKGAIAPFKTP